MTDVDPFAAQGEPRVAPQSDSELEGFVERLRQLGATDDELAQVRDGWDDFDDPTDPDATWTPEKRYLFVRLSDRHLLEAIRGPRHEYEYATHDEDEQGQLDAERAYIAAKGEAFARLGGNVGSIIDWVVTDTVRAQAVIDAEHEAAASEQRDTRKTLLEALEPLAATNPYLVGSAALSGDRSPESGDPDGDGGQGEGDGEPEGS